MPSSPPPGPEGLEIIGIGEAPSTGMRKGVVTDLEETVRAIEAATEKAERMAGVHLSHVYVGVTGEHIRSTNNRGVVAVSGDEREVISADVRRVVDASKIINLAADRQIIHALPRHYTVDGQDGVTDPLGMSGSRLEVDTHIITGGATFIANVLKCVHRAGSSPPASCSSRSRRRPRRCSPKKNTSVACCSTSAAARPTSRCLPTAA